MAYKIDISKIEKEIAEMKKSRRNNRLVIIGIVSIVGILALFLLIGVFTGMLKAPKLVGSAITCDSEECFIQAANNCVPAVFKTKIETIELKLYTSDDCFLTKEVISIDESEPEEIQDLFDGTKMKCKYARNNFDSRFVEQLSYDLMLCDGDLVDVIKRIL